MIRIVINGVNKLVFCLEKEKNEWKVSHPWLKKEQLPNDWIDLKKILTEDLQNEYF